MVRRPHSTGRGLASCGSAGAPRRCSASSFGGAPGDLPFNGSSRPAASYPWRQQWREARMTASSPISTARSPPAPAAGEVARFQRAVDARLNAAGAQPI